MNVNDQPTIFPVAPMELTPQPRPSPEVYPVQLIAPQVVEHYPIVDALREMFKEADAAAEQGMSWASPIRWEREYPSDTEAFRMYMAEIHTELKHSDAVQELRRASESKAAVTAHMVEAVFRAFERAQEAATRRLRGKMSPAQMQQVMGAGRTELDRGYRDLLVEHLSAEAGEARHYAAEDFFLILNPKARRVEYMDRQEILKTLRHSMSQEGADNLQRDVQAIRRYRAQDQELLTTEEFLQAEEQTQPETTH